jgi:hypothetical protein
MLPAHGLLNPPLHGCDRAARVAFVPTPVQFLGHDAELDDKIAGQVLRFDLAALFLLQPEQSRLVGAHEH